MEEHRFTLNVTDAVLDDLAHRLASARLPGDFSNDDWRMGVNRDYLEQLIDYWRNDYEWRSVERRINSFDNFRVDVDGIPVHFVLAKGVGPTPRALVLSHGWPWTFWDYEELIRPLSDPGSFGGDPNDAFDVVVPSLPGFGFSTPLEKAGLNFWRTADVWVSLMTKTLGYDSFFAGGGDLGNLISAQLGHKYPDIVRGIHLVGAIPLGLFSDINPIAAPDWGFRAPDQPTDNEYLQNPGVLRSRPVSAHMLVHINEPQTIAYALNDSPAGMLAWLLQRRFWWSQNDGNVEDSFTREFLITNAMIFWLTESYATSARYYAESVDDPWTPDHDLQPTVQAPTAITFFDHDATSQSRFWVEDYYNICYLNSSSVLSD